MLVKPSLDMKIKKIINFCRLAYFKIDTQYKLFALSFLADQGIDLNKSRILMFKGISKVRLLLPLNFKGISKIFEN